jgi:hypothetical protein
MASWGTSGNAAAPGDFLGTSNNQPLVVKTAGQEQVRVDTNGNVGVGISAPNFSLHLGLGNTLRIEGGTTTADAADYFSFGGNGSFGIDAPGVPEGRFVVKNSGNVGIGTGNPASKMHVEGGNDQQSTIAVSRSDNNKFMRLGVGTGGVAIDFDSSSYLVIQNNGGLGIGGILNGFELMRVTADGRVGIGTSAPASTLHVNGDVTVTGDIFVSGADCAEQFDVMETECPEPGTVLVIDENGALRKSRKAYDKKVAGVVSGAGDYRPALVLDKQPSGKLRVAVALIGKVYCKVDSQYSPINVGDLLTTSPTPGHAMKAVKGLRAFGSTIGKALRPLKTGKGLIPIMIALQ